MKSEATIRRHLANLKRAIAEPCNCAAGGHAMQCAVGGMIAQNEIKSLEWVLEDNDDHGAVVERMAMPQHRPSR